MSNSKMTEEDYHKNTSKYMVSERGRMPYDSRLVEETRERDDYVPKKETIQYVELYPMPTDEKLPEYELERLDHEWQQNWFRENGNLNIRIKTRKGDDSTNAIILSQIRKYRNDLGDFHRNDETYKLALEEFRRKNTERNELFHKRNDIRKALEKGALHSISLDDAKKLGWIIENDPKYTIHRSSKSNAQYVYPNEDNKKWNDSIWLGETIIVDKKGGKSRKSRKTKKSRKSRKMKKTKRVKRSRK